MKKACLYIRVSTDEQADKGFSQRDQEERLRAHCAKNNLQVERVIFEDYSAKTFKRPEWKKLLEVAKQSRGRRFNHVVFTKWDRFSRNTADAYQMIGILEKFDVEPVAIEQPLDFTVPESKLMLAVYLSMPEVENDRRALNVVYGMRRGKKEGRWMGKALPGYKNKITENGKKYIAIDEPAASHIRWIYNALAENIFAAEHIWMLAKEKGFKTSRSSFWDLIRNPCYCGKVTVPKFKDEEMYLVDGVHEPLISESLFYKVMDILDSRARVHMTGARVVSRQPLPLRGLLICPECGRGLTGSGSTGRKIQYWYYHCTGGCKVRYPADMANEAFERELKGFVPKAGMSDIFKMVICDTYNGDSAWYKTEKRRILEAISQQTTRMNKSRELLLSDVIDGDDFKVIKKECEDRIIRLQLELQELAAKVAHGLDMDLLVDEAINNLKNIHNFYSEADIEGKRYIAGIFYPEKWVFDGEHRTAKVNDSAMLIYHINNKLQNYKAGVKTNKSLYSGNVPSAGVEPARFPTGV